MAMMPMEGFDKLYTTLEVGGLLNVGQKTVRLWIRSGILPAARIGRAYLVAHADLQKFIAEKYQMVTEAADSEVEVVVEDSE